MVFKATTDKNFKYQTFQDEGFDPSRLIIKNGYELRKTRG